MDEIEKSTRQFVDAFENLIKAEVERYVPGMSPKTVGDANEDIRNAKENLVTILMSQGSENDEQPEEKIAGGNL